jgi:hypothetical protein
MRAANNEMMFAVFDAFSGSIIQFKMFLTITFAVFVGHERHNILHRNTRRSPNGELVPAISFQIMIGNI